MSVGDLARFNDLPGVRKRRHFPISPGERLTIPTEDQLARMPAFEAPVMRDARMREERASLATTMAAGLVVAACGVYAYQQLTGGDGVQNNSTTATRPKKARAASQFPQYGGRSPGGGRGGTGTG